MMRAVNIPLGLAAIAFTAACSAASDTKLDLNPALGDYQNEREIYRNFKSDPYFGGEAKCVRAEPTGPLVDSQVDASFTYGSGDVLDTTITVASTPGYTAGNLLEIQVKDGSLSPFNFTAAYRDCEKCKVFRHWYIENGNGCSYWVTDDALGEEATCCEFVYELLCGTSPKYQIYDESCQ